MGCSDFRGRKDAAVMIAPVNGRALVPLVALLLVTGVRGISKDAFFPYGAEVYDDELPKRDEVSSPELKLSVPLLFYNQEYEGAYVSSNSVSWHRVNFRWR